MEVEESVERVVRVEVRRRSAGVEREVVVVEEELGPYRRCSSALSRREAAWRGVRLGLGVVEEEEAMAVVVGSEGRGGAAGGVLVVLVMAGCVVCA